MSDDMAEKMIKVYVPCKIVSVANRSEHWTAKYRRQRSQKEIVYLTLLRDMPEALFNASLIPKKVIFCRYSTRLLDSDNLVIAFKHIRDQVASFFSVKDSPSDPISWEYCQEKSKKYEFSIQIYW